MSTLYIDIETLPEEAYPDMPHGTAPGWSRPDASTFFVEPARRTVPSSYKKAETVARWEANEDERHAAAIFDAVNAAELAVDEDRDAAWESWKKGSLSPMTGRIACISMAFDDEAVEVIECAEDEAAGLLEMGDRLRRPAIIVAHNGHGFDFEWIWKRSMKHRFPKLAAWFRQPKPWDDQLLDTLMIWNNGARHNKRGTLDALCKFLDVKRAPSAIDGAGVLDAYISGRWHEVVEHAAADIEDLREIYLRLREAT
jgi:hypothetical protein